MRAPSAEAFVNGKAVTKENIEQFGKEVLHDINPRESWRGGKKFREHMAVVMAQRALRESIRKAGGEVR